jgi:hypothetical protein
MPTSTPFTGLVIATPEQVQAVNAASDSEDVGQWTAFIDTLRGARVDEVSYAVRQVMKHLHKLEMRIKDLEMRQQKEKAI